MTMENDLVERLRRAVWRLSGSGLSQVQFWKAYGDKLDGITKTEVERHEKSRIQALEAELARKTEALDQVAEWARAYPLSVFPEPDFAKVRELLWAGGIMIDAVSASNMRHVITQVASIARSALEEKTDV